MTYTVRRTQLPQYHGRHWVSACLPDEGEQWPADRPMALSTGDGAEEAVFESDILAYTAGKPWVWPGRTHYFICDMHADTDAFLASLVATGGVEKTGPADDDIRLTAAGQEAVFVIGGDCLDKGPSDLRLLRALADLRGTGANVVLLAGNHDMLAMGGLASIGRGDDPRLDHLFVKMGLKALPLLREVWDGYLANRRRRSPMPSEKAIRENLFPGKAWRRTFAAAAAGLVPERRIAKLQDRIDDKCRQFEAACRERGMTLAMVYEASLTCRDLFLEPRGEFGWYFAGLDLAYRAGSCLFVHAGMDDLAARVVREAGADDLNRRFRQLVTSDLFALYHGPVGNVFRTRYRGRNWPLTPAGIADLHASGIYALVHGHQNLRRGQRLSLRDGMLNVECDASVDATTRRIEGLNGPGAAATVFTGEGAMVGISTDHPFAKVFDATRLTDVLTIV